MLNETPTLAPDGLPYRLLTLRNRAGMVVTLMDWGATLLSARVPMPDGSVRETLLGCASPEQYVNQSAFLGAWRTLSFQVRVRTSFTADRKGLINAAGKLSVKMTAKCCSRWIRVMAIRASRATLSPPHASR